MSLLELIIGVSILAIVMAIGAPSFFAWARNLQIRNAAESVSSGLQRARAEAVARNTNVTFALGADTSWAISVVAPAEIIETRAAAEGSQDTTRTVLPMGASSITYNNLGITVVNADGTPTLTQVDVAAVGGAKSMRVTIGVGGNAKMCDPSLAAGSNAAAC